MAGFQVVLQTIVYICLFATSLAFVVPEKRIVNGQQAANLTHPYVASVQVKKHGEWHHACGGALIARDKVLTAAHCDLGKRNENIRIGLGVSNIYASLNDYECVATVSSYVVHEDYTGEENDLAIIYLTAKVELNSRVQIAALPPKDASFANSRCIMAGWGSTYPGNRASHHLMEAKIEAIPTSECKARYHGRNVSHKTICAYEGPGRPGYRPSGCHGDSGGPLMCGRDFKYLAGIVSWGQANCNGNYPSVFMRVTEYLDWIAAH